MRLTAMDTTVEEVDVLVVGAGFGGLGAAMGLVDRGARVLVCERLDYPGGCAGTFERRGCRYDAGATLSSGFGAGQLFAGWAERHAMALRWSALDPVVELRTAQWTLPVWAERARFIDEIAGLAGGRGDAVRRFFAYQAGVAATLWRVLDEPSMLPPLGAGGLLAHLKNVGGYLPVARWMGRPLTAVLARFGLEDVAPLRAFCDAVCQITVQCPAHEAEAPFALATLDYFFRGVAHVHGGIGELARGIVEVLRRRGAEVRQLCPVRGLRRDGDRWYVDTRRGPVRARAVVANLLPQALSKLLEAPGEVAAPLGRMAAGLGEGWGAAMLYMVVRPPEDAPVHAHHLELIDDAAAPLIEGNHLFASISGADEVGRAPPGRRVITVSTHLPAARLREGDVASYVGAVQRRMRAVFAARAPEWAAGIEACMTGSPRTFERYTGRTGGLVGGAPRRAGLRNYANAWPKALAPGLWLVGDSVFPGQSTVATALGGLRTAAALAASLG